MFTGSYTALAAKPVTHKAHTVQPARSQELPPQQQSLAEWAIWSASIVMAIFLIPFAYYAVKRGRWRAQGKAMAEGWKQGMGSRV